MGLLGLWREALLAKKLRFGQVSSLSDAARRYGQHPHMRRFNATLPYPIVHYLKAVYWEGIKRGYKLNKELVDWDGDWFAPIEKRIEVTIGQLEFELQLLKQRVYIRDGDWYNKRLRDLAETVPEPNPVFIIAWGPREEWDKGKLKEEGDWTRYCQLPASQTNHMALQKEREF
jgi:hypothetical protein